jgi:hypothetical protein
MIPVANAGGIIAIASASIFHVKFVGFCSSPTYAPLIFIAAVAIAGGLTAASIYLIAPDGKGSKLNAVMGGLATSIVMAAALIAMGPYY